MSKIKNFVVENIKLIKIIGFSLLGVAIAAGIITPMVILFTDKSSPGNKADVIQRPKNELTNPNQIYWYDFMSLNSYKVEFKWETPAENNQVIVTTVSGTAWSWYYTYTNNEFVWYLMTNFHVVNDFIYWLSGENSNYLNTQSFEINNTNKEFIMKNWSKNNKYSEIDLSKNCNSISVIVDNKTNSANLNPNLFSNQVNSVNRYNLDMALIKLTFSGNHTQTMIDKNIQNPFKTYLNNKDFKGFNNSTNSNTIIGGNPVDGNKLVVQRLRDENWKENYNNVNISIDNNTNFAEKQLAELIAPYTYTNNYFSNWELTGGASGSAVYQINADSNTYNEDYFDKQSIYEVQMMPVGIYWGAYVSNNLLAPSIIPFVSNSYNVFENFESFIKY